MESLSRDTIQCGTVRPDDSSSISTGRRGGGRRPKGRSPKGRAATEEEEEREGPPRREDWPGLGSCRGGWEAWLVGRSWKTEPPAVEATAG